MGILGDLIRGKFQADQAHHKVTIAEAQAKMKSLDNLSKLTDMITQYQDQQSQADRGAFQLSPGSEDLNIMNPDIQPVAQPSGQRLLNQFMQTFPEHAGTIMTTTLNPERQIKSAVLPLIQNAMKGLNAGSAPTGGEVIPSAIPGAETTGGTGAMGPLAQKIFDNPLLGAAMKASGLDVVPSIQAATAAARLNLQRQDADTRTEFNIKTGRVEQYDVNKYTRKEIPGTRKETKGEDITWQEYDIKDVGKVKVPFKIVNGVPVQIPFDVKMPGGTGENGQPSMPGIVTQRPEGQQQIQKTELSSWINPDTGQFPNKTMTTQELESGGFVPYKPLAGEQAARFAKSVNSLENLPDVDKFLFDSKGNLRKMNWSKMKLGIGDGATVKGKLLQAAWAQIRNESGAAVTDKEVADLANQYVTNLLSITDPKGIKDGMRRLGADLKGYVDITDPTGVHQKVMGRKPYEITEPAQDVIAPSKTPAGSAPQRQPGESAADFLKRTGG